MSLCKMNYINKSVFCDKNFVTKIHNRGFLAKPICENGKHIDIEVIFNKFMEVVLAKQSH